MARAYLGLGSNQGNRVGLLNAALERLEASGRVRVIKRSSLYETAPVGVTDQPRFVNLVAEVHTDLEPQGLLELALAAERTLGRVRTQRWGPRTVDIDILLYDEVQVDTPTLAIPHPEMTRRRFVLEPLLEIAPDAALPDGRPVGGALVAVEGPIGVGKTTLARLLAAPLRAAAVLEVVEENPFLHHFYQDMRGYAFQTQIFFFLSRYRQQEVIRRAREQGQAVVSDYIFAKDRLFAQMNLDAEELDLYTRLFDLIAPMTVQPALVIYLTAHLETLLDRIAHRDRPFERAIEPGYLDRLSDEYARFFAEYDQTALLTVDTDEVDIFTEKDLKEILQSVDLAGNNEE